MNILQQIATLLGVKLTKVHEKTVANKEAIEAEVKRAQASETLLDTNIKNETKRAHDEEARIELKAVDLVTKEETRAIAAESALSTKIDTDVKAEADRAKGAEEAIINNLNSEINRAKAAEKTNSDNITALDEKKVDKVEGKQLSTEDYTTAEKTKVKNLSSYVISNTFEESNSNSDLLFQYSTRDSTTGSVTRHYIDVPIVSDTFCGVMTPSQKLVLDNLLSGDSALSILGTPSSTWQLNLGSGPKIKNSGGIFELRNATDSAYADLTVNALTIKGNVTQEGGSFITQAETVSAKDNTILLNSGETGAGVTKGEAGVEIDRGTLPKYKFVFDESDDRFKVGSEGDLWSVMLRDNETDLTDKGILTWDATTKRAKTAFNVDDLSTKYLPLEGNTRETPITGKVILGSTGSINDIYGRTIISQKASASGTSMETDIGTHLVPSTVDIHSRSSIRRIPEGGITFTVWDSGNDGEGSGLDADLLDGQHGSYYAKATDLGSYIPLAGNSTSTPITGHLYTKDVFGWGLYGMKIEGADGLPRTAHIQFNANQTGAMGSEPAKSNAYTEMGSVGEVWGPNTVSQLRVGYEDNLPVLKYRNNPEGPEIKEYNIYHEGNLDVSKFDDYIPLSGTVANKPITGMLEIEDNSTQGGFYGKSIEHADGISRSTRLLFNNSIGSDAGCIVTLGCLGAESYRSMLVVGHYKHRPMLRFDYHDGDSTSQLKRAEVYHEGNLDISKFALKTDLDNIDMSNYLPLSGGTMTEAIRLAGAHPNDALQKGLKGYRGWLSNGSDDPILSYTEDSIIFGAMGAGLTLWGSGFQINTSGNTNVTVGDLWLQATNEIMLNAPIIHDNNGNKFWTAGNDGAGSGLDADLLDGKQGSEYALKSEIGSSSSLTTPVVETEDLAVPSVAETTAVFKVKTSTSGGNDGFIWANNWGNNFATQLFVDPDHNHIISYRQRDSNGVWNNWARLALSYELSNYLPLSGGKMSGTITLPTEQWIKQEQNITSNYTPIVRWAPGGTIDGSNIGRHNTGGDGTGAIVLVPYASDKNSWERQIGLYIGKNELLLDGKPVALKENIPTSLPANGGTSTHATYLKVNDLRASATNPDYGDKEIIGWFNNLGTPNNAWWSGIHVKGWQSDYGAWELAGPSDSVNPPSDALWFRSGRGTTWNGWKRVAFANEIPTTLPASDVYSWAKAASKPSYGWAEITGKPASMPASDVYAWAKASAKPSYAWGEIVSKPTNLSTAGINDGVTSVSVTGSGNAITTASISGHILTLSRGTTFLTSHQSLANYVTLNTAQTITGAKTFSAFVICSAGAGTSSDIRLKKYINRMFDAEEILSNLSGYRYVMKETDMHYAGLIAQEVQEVLPEAVREDEKGFLTVDTYPIVAALVEANKAKDNRIKALEDRLSALEKKMSLILNK